jgi:hypothetical protein
MSRAMVGRLVVVLVGALGIAPGVASGASWMVLSSPNRLVAQGVLSGVSCTSPASCLAVGRSANGRGFSVPLAESWNGTSWAPQSVSVGGSESLLSGVSCTGATACTAVGSHRNPAGVQMTLALARTGTSWAVQPTPNPAGATASVLSSVSCTAADACTAVGSTTAPSGVTVALAERFNGAGWSIRPVPQPTGAMGSQLSAVSCPSAMACTAVGAYTNSGGATLSLAERWNGATWAPEQTVDPASAGTDELSGVSCTSSTACMAVGSANAGDGQVLAELWNGAKWAIQATPDPAAGQQSRLLGVSCFSSTACTAVGSYRDSGFIGHTLAERWNGAAWTIQSTPDPAGAPRVLSGVACASSTACTAAGSSGTGITLTLAEHWNGASWAIQPTLNPAGELNNDLNAVSCSSPTACTAVGEYTDSASHLLTLAESWNGTSWAIQPSASPAGADSQLLGVSCSSSDACTAVGFDQRTGAPSVTLAERWNGTSWTIQSTPNPAGASTSVLTSVSCSALDACTAVGYHFAGGNPVAPLAERWNGTSWAIQPISGPSGTTHSQLSGVSCSGPNACTAVGSYKPFPSESETLAERWNGTAWAIQSTPNPTSGTQPSLSAVSCGALTACTAVGDDYDGSETGNTVPLALAWNGSAWSLESTPEPSGSANDQLLGVSCAAASACTSVGGYDDITNRGVTLAEAWSGTSWTVQPTPNAAGAQGNLLSAVSCTSPTSCMAAGGYGGDGSTATLVERYG